MDVNALGALSSFSYQSVLAQTGNADNALSQALATSQSQAADRNAHAPARVAPVSALDALRADAASQSAPSQAPAPAAGNGAGAQTLVSLLNSGTSALLPASDSLPTSAAAMLPANSESLVRYAYDQSQNPNSASHQATSAAQQSPQSSSLNLLA